MYLIRGGWGESTTLLVTINLPWQVFKKTFTKIEAYSGMAERTVRDLAIEEALQADIKETLKHNNRSYVDCCALSDKG